MKKMPKDIRRSASISMSGRGWINGKRVKKQGIDEENPTWKPVSRKIVEMPDNDE